MNIHWRASKGTECLQIRKEENQHLPIESHISTISCNTNELRKLPSKNFARRWSMVWFVQRKYFVCSKQLKDFFEATQRRRHLLRSSIDIRLNNGLVLLSPKREQRLHLFEWIQLFRLEIPFVFCALVAWLVLFSDSSLLTVTTFLRPSTIEPTDRVIFPSKTCLNFTLFFFLPDDIDTFLGWDFTDCFPDGFSMKKWKNVVGKTFITTPAIRGNKKGN